MTDLGVDNYSWTIEQRLTNELRKLVISGEFEPGARLQYRTLAERFGVSVTPVRAALRDLGNEGLVEIRPNIGARVTELSLDELEEVYLARIGFEPWLARLGAPRLSDDNVRVMSTRLERFVEAIDERNVEKTLDTGWHMRLVCYEAAGRARVLESARTHFNRARRYNRRTLSTASRFGQVKRDGRTFYGACADRDGQAAADSIRVTLERSFNDIAKRLDKSLEAMGT